VYLLHLKKKHDFGLCRACFRDHGLRNSGATPALMAYLTVLYAAIQHLQMNSAPTFRRSRRAAAPPTVYLLCGVKHERRRATRV
jgi:hypothetical protein